MEKDYVIVESGSKQYAVKQGDIIDIELVSGERGESVVLDQVLFLKQGETVLVGSPVLTGVKVQGEIVGQVRGPKVISYKYKKRHNYRRKVGHRQDYTRIKITGVQHGT